MVGGQMIPASTLRGNHRQLELVWAPKSLLLKWSGVWWFQEKEKKKKRASNWCFVLSCKFSKITLGAQNLTVVDMVGVVLYVHCTKIQKLCICISHMDSCPVTICNPSKFSLTFFFFFFFLFAHKTYIKMCKEDYITGNDYFGMGPDNSS